MKRAKSDAGGKLKFKIEIFRFEFSQKTETETDALKTEEEMNFKSILIYFKI